MNWYNNFGFFLPCLKIPSNLNKSIFKVSKSISINFTLAPQYNAALTVETHVRGVVII